MDADIEPDGKLSDRVTFGLALRCERGGFNNIHIYIYIQSHSTFSRPAPGPWPGSRSCRLRPEPQVWKDQCLGGRPQDEGIGFSSAMS